MAEVMSIDEVEKILKSLPKDLSNKLLENISETIEDFLLTLAIEDGLKSEDVDNQYFIKKLEKELHES